MRHYHFSLAAALIAALMAAGVTAPALADVKAGFAMWERGDYAQAVSEWRPLAIAGDAQAQYNLAQAYRLGRGVPTDLKQAEIWYGKAAAQGNVQARDNYGLLLFQNGDRAGAMRYIRESAERGEPRAQYVLATAMFNGDGVPKDWVRGYALMTRASASGLPAASQSLAQMDKYIPLDQRQRGLALARTMETNAARTIFASEATTPPQSERAPARRPERAPERKPVRAAAGRDVGAPPVREAATPPCPTVAVASRPAVGGRWRVQLGAFGDASKVDALWKTLHARIDALGPYQSYVVRAGSVTRLQAGPLPSSAAAAKLCASVRAAGQACLPVAS